MPDRRFEDKLSFEDLLKKPPEEIRVLTYMQTVKTNGTVSRHDKCIAKLEEEMKERATKKDIEKTNTKVDGKIGRGIFITMGSILTVILAYIAVTQTLATMAGG